MDINFFLPAAIVIVSTWLLVLSIVVYTFVLRGKKQKTVPSGDLSALVEQQAEKIDKLEHYLSATRSQLNGLDAKSIGFVQKVGFVRFNPFAETGGDHSFSVALMDGNNDGFVITSLHTRAGTRSYAKAINAGKSDQEFSREEQKAIDIALNNNE